MSANAAANLIAAIVLGPLTIVLLIVCYIEVWDEIKRMWRGRRK